MLCYCHSRCEQSDSIGGKLVFNFEVATSVRDNILLCSPVAMVGIILFLQEIMFGRNRNYSSIEGTVKSNERLLNIKHRKEGNGVLSGMLRARAEL